ncbi:hypothetical protein C8Q75DRAFT_165708 [Abortiporus biennis]|nr:hypothetical protein C8Q75DRAFT_165708 [Abortiporus biennis]
MKFMKKGNQVALYLQRSSGFHFFGRFDFYGKDSDENWQANYNWETLADCPDIPPIEPIHNFINYYQVRYRWFFQQTMFANAEPKDPSASPPNDHDDNSSGSKVRCDTWKPLDELLNYLLRNTSADQSIACDDDVFFVCKGHDPFPKDFREFYDRVAPRIYVDDNNVASLYREEYLPAGRRDDNPLSSSPPIAQYLKTPTIGLDIMTIFSPRDPPLKHSPIFCFTELINIQTSRVTGGNTLL